MRSDRERLLDILEAIERIEKHAVRGRQAFEQDDLIQTWVIHHLEIIGEACRALSASLRERHPEVNWRGIVGTRNILAHHYFEMDLEIVWSVVEHDLPALKRSARAILAELPPADVQP